MFNVKVTGQRIHTAPVLPTLPGEEPAAPAPAQIIVDLAVESGVPAPGTIAFQAELADRETFVSGKRFAVTLTPIED